MLQGDGIMHIAKKGIALLCAGILLLCGCTRQGKTHTPRETKTQQEAQAQEVMRAVWLSYLELPTTKDVAAAAYRETIQTMLAKVAAQGYNAVIVQVRPFADAIYPSAVFPWSVRLTGGGAAPDYDPLQILLETAHALDLQLHAWINPFRIASKPEPAALTKTHPAQKWLQSQDTVQNSFVCVLDNGIYFNPASP